MAPKDRNATAASDDVRHCLKVFSDTVS